MNLSESNEPNKILFVVQNDSLGGAEQLLKMMANEYSLNNYTVEVIIVRRSMHGNWCDINENILIKFLNKRTYFVGFIYLALYLFYYSRKYKIDSTISSNININALLGFLKNTGILKTKKLIIRETTSVFLRFKGFKKYVHIIKYLIGYSSASLIISQTEIMRQQFLSNLKSSSKWKMIIIHNPINLNRIRELSFLLPEGFNITSERKYIVSAGRFIPEKGFDILIKAFSEIQEKYSEYDLLIFGEGALRNKYDDLINMLKLNNRVFLPGFVQNPIPFFKKASICVVSSIFEGFPNVLLQMAATNNTVISTLCAGEIDKIPGILTCRPNDFKDLAIKLKSCINSQVENEEIQKKQIYLESNNVQQYLFNINEYFLRQ
jgi:glycosyltransferase involved in cell wall biosynthesis